MQDTKEALKSGHMIAFLLVRSHHVRPERSTYTCAYYLHVYGICLWSMLSESIHSGQFLACLPPSRRRHEIAQVWRSLGYKESDQAARHVCVLLV
jgi:hypothetical protein